MCCLSAASVGGIVKSFFLAGLSSMMLLVRSWSNNTNYSKTDKVWLLMSLHISRSSSNAWVVLGNFSKKSSGLLPLLPNEETVSYPVNACMEKRESGTNPGCHRWLVIAFWLWPPCAHCPGAKVTVEWMQQVGSIFWMSAWQADQDTQIIMSNWCWVIPWPPQIWMKNLRGTYNIHTKIRSRVQVVSKFHPYPTKRCHTPLSGHINNCLAFWDYILLLERSFRVEWNPG